MMTDFSVEVIKYWAFFLTFSLAVMKNYREHYFQRKITRKTEYFQMAY